MADKATKTTTDEATENLALEVTSHINTAIAAPIESDYFIPSSREELALLTELQNELSQIESLGVQTTLSKDLAAAKTVFHITNAFTSETKSLNPQEAAAGVMNTVVVFQLVDAETGEEYTVVKGGNAVNKKYASAFSKFAAMRRPLRMENYMFVESEKYVKMGNKAVIIVRAPAPMKNVTK